jgi:hypothetical protein
MIDHVLGDPLVVYGTEHWQVSQRGGDAEETVPGTFGRLSRDFA